MSDEQGEKRFRILICVDGSDSSYSGLRYAVRMGGEGENIADLTLLYVRPLDKGLSLGGMQMEVSNSNMLSWGHDLPGMRALKKGRDMLVDMGFISESWQEKVVHTDVRGDPLGDNAIVYTNEDNAQITMKLMVSPSVERGILDEIELGEYDITIIGMCDEKDMGPGKIRPAVTKAVASQSPGCVIVARDLEQDHGHFMCVDFADKAIAAAKRDAQIASRCHCPQYLYTVAETEEQIPEAKDVLQRAREAVAEAGLEIAGEMLEVGDPVEKIVTEGRKYSLIVLADSSVKGLRRFFQTSVAYEVMEKAENSVMIVR